jgi:periplasmic protein TonB
MSRKIQINAMVVLVAALFLDCQPGTPAAAKEYSIGTQAASQFVDAQILASPQPLIPPELHEHCFKSCCLARFLINPDGKATVKLLSSSGSSDLDDITLSTLKRWKFRPATLDGKPVSSARKIKVEFEVE